MIQTVCRRKPLHGESDHSMGQQDIKQYLQMHGASTVKELANSLDRHPQSIRSCLRSMKKWGEVKKRKGEISYKADQWYLPEEDEEEKNPASVTVQEDKMKC